MLSSLEGKGILIKGEWAKGKTRVFMRTAQSIALETHREGALSVVACVVQKWVRRFIRKARYREWIVIIRNLKEAAASRDEDQLDKAVAMSAELPYGGASLPALKEAKKVLAVVQEENRLLKLVKNAIESKNLSSLHSAIATASATTSPAPALTALISEAKALIAALEEELAIKAELVAAVKDKDLAKLIASTKKAEGKGMTSIQEYTTAMALKRRALRRKKASSPSCRRLWARRTCLSSTTRSPRRRTTPRPPSAPSLLQLLLRETRLWKSREPRRGPDRRLLRRRLLPTWPPRMRAWAASCARQ